MDKNLNTAAESVRSPLRIPCGDILKSRTSSKSYQLSPGAQLFAGFMDRMESSVERARLLAAIDEHLRCNLESAPFMQPQEECFDAVRKQFLPVVVKKYLGGDEQDMCALGPDIATSKAMVVYVESNASVAAICECQGSIERTLGYDRLRNLCNRLAEIRKG